MLIRLTLILLLLLLLPAAIIFWHFRSHLRSRGRRLLFWTPHMALIGSAAAMIIGHIGASNMNLLGRFAVAMLAVVGCQLVFLVFCLLGRLLRTVHLEAACLWIGMAAAMATLAVILYGHLCYKRHLRVVRTEISHKDIPHGFDGYRIALFTDLHAGTYSGDLAMVERIVNSINALHPDVIVFSGDVVNHDVAELLESLPHLSRLNAPDGIFAVMGNHDYLDYRHWSSLREQAEAVKLLRSSLTEAGWHYLLNSAVLIHRGSDSIALVGVENDGKPPFPQRGDLARSLSRLPADTNIYKVLLSHDPSHWHRHVLAETDIQLMLSGHTHAAQLQIGRWSPSRLAYDEWAGLYEEHTARDGDKAPLVRHLLVSRGVGASLPFRLGAWPEINLITLHSIK